MIAGPIKFVLLQGVGENSQITRFIQKYGAGPQHIAIEVEDCETACQELENQGLEFNTNIIKGPQLTQRFSKRCENSGVMLEFIERKENSEGFSEQNVSDLFKQLEQGDNF
ncbi:VOC family protein [Kushneria aurantia]|uniref:VOC family protein n=1 Tax=Kushneria aurantia TaxID=504092 RepID=A0ABV6G6M9_9GAMM|nr:VOC family protein [Kushneria aurantia]